MIDMLKSFMLENPVIPVQNKVFIKYHIIICCFYTGGHMFIFHF